MKTAYQASPECAERQCRITRREDPRWFASIYQHGENPEAVLFVDHVSSAVDPAAEVRQQFRAWAERIHRYEDGARDGVRATADS